MRDFLFVLLACFTFWLAGGPDKYEIEPPDPDPEIDEDVLLAGSMIDQAAVSLDDGDALEAVELFPAWLTNIDYAVDYRVRYLTKLYRCVQAHTSQADWTPDKTPALWTEVAKPGEIPVWRQPTGAQDAYNKGDKVWFPEKDTKVYESLIDSNVYSPEAYPAGWKEIS